MTADGYRHVSFTWPHRCGSSFEVGGILSQRVMRHTGLCISHCLRIGYLASTLAGFHNCLASTFAPAAARPFAFEEKAAAAPQPRSRKCHTTRWALPA